MQNPYSNYKTACTQSSLQKMQMSASMQESLKVLQMPIEELTLWMQEKIEQNPLIEWKEEISPFKEGYTSYSKGGHKRLETPVLIEAPYKVSSFEYLMNQAHQMFSEKKSLKIAEWIIGNLEPTGFYPDPFKSIPSSFSLEEFKGCLEEIKQFDPPGIAAESMQESLLIQLKSQGKENTLSYLIIEQHLNDLLDGNFKQIQKKTQIDETSIRKAIQSDVASLDPFPGYRFHKEPSPLLSVDIFLIEEEELLKIYVKEPPLISEIIYPIGDSLSSEEKNFIKTCRSESKWIIQAIKKRSSTLKKVAEHLINMQRNYIQGNSNTLIPLSIQQVADKLELHESTITRAIADKNLSCPLGIIPLKSLFSKGLSEDISCDLAKKILRKLISEEDKRAPLSDRELLEKMQRMGIPCARRTVTKYRQNLHIPAKRIRKSQKPG